MNALRELRIRDHRIREARLNPPPHAAAAAHPHSPHAAGHSAGAAPSTGPGAHPGVLLTPIQSPGTARMAVSGGSLGEIACGIDPRVHEIYRAAYRDGLSVPEGTPSSSPCSSPLMQVSAMSGSDHDDSAGSPAPATPGAVSHTPAVPHAHLPVSPHAPLPVSPLGRRRAHSEAPATLMHS